MMLHHRNRNLLKFTLLIISSTLGFLICEIYTRATRHHVDLHVHTGRVIGPNPMRDWAFLDAFSGYRVKPKYSPREKSVNSFGFVSTPEIALRKPDNTTRIAFLGGSSTAGTKYLSDAETWPWKTTGLLERRTGKRLEFLNAGLGGYTSFESFGRLWSRIRYFSPDILVVYHGWNELYYFGEVDDIVSWRSLPDGSWSFDRTSAPVQRVAPLGIDPFIGWSQFLTRIRLRLSKSATDETGWRLLSELETSFDHRGLEIWRSNLQLFKAVAEAIGARLVVVKQATLIVEDLPESERARCRYDLHGFDHDAHVAAFKGLYRVIDEVFEGDSIIDARVLSGQPDLFRDHIHLTPRGASELSSLVAGHLAPLLEGG